MNMNKKVFSSRNLLLAASILLVCTVLPLTAQARADGSIINITSLPYVINQPGTYVLTSNLTVTDSDGIILNVSDTGGVIIDGRGHTIRLNGGSGVGINMSNNLGVVLRNITIEGFTTGIYVNTEQVGYSGTTTNNNVVLIENTVITGCQTGLLIENENPPVWVVNTRIEVPHNGVGIKTYSIYDGGVNIEDTIVTGGSVGVEALQSYYVGLVNTTVTGSRIGVLFEGVEYCGAFGSKIIGNTEYGMLINGSSDTIMLAFMEIAGSQTGIMLDRCEDTPVYSSYIHNNTIGVLKQIYSGWTNFELYNNTIVNNDKGAMINGSGSNRITWHVDIEGNLIARNTLGLWINADGGHIIGDINWNHFINTHNINASEQTLYTSGTSSLDVEHNYWSDYTGNDNYTINSMLSDQHPLTSTLPEITIDSINPRAIEGDNVLSVEITLTNHGGIDANSVPIVIGYSLPPVFREVEYQWVNPPAQGASSASDGDYYDDEGNYVLSDEDDELFGYKLPFELDFYGISVSNMSLSTNGYVELTNSNIANHGDQQYVLGDEYNTHQYLYNYYYQEELFSWYDRLPSLWNEVVLYGYDGDLYVLDQPSYMAVYNLGGHTVLVDYYGSTCGDADLSRPVQYQLLISDNGTIRVNIGSINYTDLYGDGFTGISMVNPLQMEIIASYQSPQNRSYQIDDVRFHALATRSINVPAGSTVTVTINTSLPSLESDYLVSVKLGEDFATATGAPRMLGFIKPVIVHAPQNQPSQGGQESAYVPLTPQQRDAIKLVKSVVRENIGRITNAQELEMHKPEIENAMQKLVETGLIKTSPPHVSQIAKEKLRRILEALYGPCLETYPFPEGRVYLLYWLYLEE